MEDEKEGAGTSIKIAIEFITPGLMKYRRKKETTIIVDVDDKNCLAQLTVALKFDQSR